MANWILMFRPDTYEIVKQIGIIGVLHIHRRRFAALRTGDRFISYVSRLSVLDGHGTLTSDPFEDDERIFGAGHIFPYRCHVTFLDCGLLRPAGDALWDLAIWKER